MSEMKGKNRLRCLSVFNGPGAWVQLPEEARELDKKLRGITKEKNEAVRGQDFEKVRQSGQEQIESDKDKFHSRMALLAKIGTNLWIWWREAERESVFHILVSGGEFPMICDD